MRQLDSQQTWHILTMENVKLQENSSLGKWNPKKGKWKVLCKVLTSDGVTSLSAGSDSSHAPQIWKDLGEKA